MSFPDPNATHYVFGSFAMASGETLTVALRGPFEFPDQARQARDQMLTESDRCSVLHCVEVLGVDDE